MHPSKRCPEVSRGVQCLCLARYGQCKPVPGPLNGHHTGPRWTCDLNTCTKTSCALFEQAFARITSAPRDALRIVNSCSPCFYFLRLGEIVHWAISVCWVDLVIWGSSACLGIRNAETLSVRVGAYMGPYGPLRVLLDRSWQVRTCPISDF